MCFQFPELEFEVVEFSRGNGGLLLEATKLILEILPMPEGLTHCAQLLGITAASIEELQLPGGAFQSHVLILTVYFYQQVSQFSQLLQGNGAAIDPCA